ncbi:MAG: hypothetical protein WD176_07140 [Pirellulales bacterium]
MSLRKHVFRLSIVGAFFSVAAAASAQNVPPAAPIGPAPTLFHFLGLRQGSWRASDNFRNRNGNRPNRERKPPLKRIADPGLKEIDNPAIKTAQRIKEEEDLAPQKIKAIKYLATLGCEKCYGGIEEAMLEALKDCTEEVRYETVRALGTIPNAECPQCDNDCCTEKMTEQLAKIAYERDPDHPDCWYEPSARVRAAAIETLNICCPNRQAPPTVVEGPIVNPETPINPETTPGEGSPPPPPTPPPGASAAKGRLPAMKFGRQVMGPSSRVKHPTVTSPANSGADTVWVSDAAKSPQSKIEAGVIAAARATEPARLSATLRQPTTLTARAQQPTVRPAVAGAKATLKTQRPSIALAQPGSLRPVARPIAGEASENIVRPRSENGVRPLPKTEARLRQPAKLVPAGEPIRLTRASTGQKSSPASFDVPSSANANASSDFGTHVTRGAVAKVSADAGIVQVKFPGGSQPPIGSRLKIYHAYLMKTACVGELEVVSLGSGMVTARPLGDVQLSKIGAGDAAVVVQ